MELENKKVLVIGTGISGIGAAKLLLKAGAVPVLYDENENAKPEEIRSRLAGNGNVEIFIGSLPGSVTEEICLAVPSPGVPADTEFMEGLRKKGIPVWGELELGYRYAKGLSLIHI